MDLLKAQNPTRNPDDGVKAIYECQSCLRVDSHIVDAYAIPDHIRCGECGYYEGDENSE